MLLERWRRDDDDDDDVRVICAAGFVEETIVDDSDASVGYNFQSLELLWLKIMEGLTIADA